MIKPRIFNKKTLKITLIILISFVFIFSIVSMIITKNIYDNQFPRFDRPEFSGYLRYDDVEEYKRTAVKFKSGKNTLTGYLYGEENDK